MSTGKEGDAMAKRWRPPPMNESGSDEGGGEGPKVTVDEQVVRKMLQVNPSMRAGRTTHQVKSDMERGAPGNLDGGDGAAATAAPGSPTAGSPTAGSPTKSDLDDTLGLFMNGKAAELAEQLDALAQERKRLEAHEAALREQFAGDIAKFLSMLDAKVVALHGVTSLSKHKDFLERVGLSPAQILEAARKARS